jgi:hypothetical protein
MSEQTNPSQETPADLLAVEGLDHFISLLTDWHNRQVATVKHLHAAPEGIKIIIGDGDDAEEKSLEGEFLAGFQLGLDLALNYLGTLPFMAEYADDNATQH